jgi:hypothetical protein
MNPNEVLSLPVAPAPALNMAAAADSMFNAAGTDMVILESSNSGMLKRNRLLARRKTTFVANRSKCCHRTFP